MRALEEREVADGGRVLAARAHGGGGQVAGQAEPAAVVQQLRFQQRHLARLPLVDQAHDRLRRLVRVPCMHAPTWRHEAPTWPRGR